MDGTALLRSLLSADGLQLSSPALSYAAWWWLPSALPCCLLSGLSFGALEVCNPLSDVAVVDLLVLFSKMTLVLGKSGFPGARAA